MAIKVKAKEMGYYGQQRRRPGDVFEIQDESERGNWMIDADALMPPPKAAMPLTSNVQGTKAGGNTMPSKKEAWEEPVSDSSPEQAPEVSPPEADNRYGKKNGKKGKS